MEDHRKITDGGCMCWKKSSMQGSGVGAHRFKMKITENKKSEPKIIEQIQGKGSVMGERPSSNQRKRILDEISAMLTSSKK